MTRELNPMPNLYRIHIPHLIGAEEHLGTDFNFLD